jgi:dTDP-4-dehydrorhamnose 3,5-epimerase
MKFEELPLPGAFLVRTEPHVDDRGSFMRTFCEREFAAHGLPTRFPQCNLSRNHRAGTMRGMHYNAAPHQEAKLVRCVRGKIYDVIVDLRRNSSTWGRSAGVELDAEGTLALYVPDGFAHGFLTLADDTDVFYHMAGFFVSEAARGFRYDDPAFRIEWPSKPRVLSPRDESYTPFDESTFDG